MDLVKMQILKGAVITVLLWGIVCFFFFQIFYSHHLFHREQMQLFLFSFEYLLTFLDKPAWFACLSGDFLTQFFYYIGVGAIIVTVVLILLIGITYQACRKICSEKYAFVFALIIGTCEFFRNTGLNYSLSSTIALAGGFLFGWIGCTLFHNKTIHVFLNLFLLSFGYWIFGSGIWITLILFVIFEIKEFSWRPAFLYLILLFIPLLLRSHYLLTIPQCYKYPVNSFWNTPNMQEEEILEIDQTGYFGNWTEVIEKAQLTKNKNAITSYFYNLTNSRLSRLPERLMNYYQPATHGLFLDVNHRSSVLEILFSNEVWFWLGDMTMAEHAAMLGQIFSYNKRSARMTKRLAEINLVTGETAAAEKYLNILSQTLCYKKWANARRPQNQTRTYKKWLNIKKRNSATNDTLRYNNDVITSLRNLLDNNKNNKAALDYLLCYQLLNKNITGFMADYNLYFQPLGHAPESIYAEAVLIYLAQQKASQLLYISYNLPQQAVKDFWNYTELYEKGDANSLQDNFDKSYWFYYHFATFKKNE